MAMSTGNDYCGAASRQQTEEDLIRALNNLRANLVDLSKEVSRATQLREQMLKEKAKPVSMPVEYIREAIKDLQRSIGHPVTGKLSLADIALLKERKVAADDIKIWQ